MVENRMKQINHYLQKKANSNGTDWAQHISYHTFVMNTSILKSSTKSPHEIIFGVKPEIPVSMKLGLFRDIHGDCTREGFCEGLPPHHHNEEEAIPKEMRHLLKPKVSIELLKRENALKRAFLDIYRESEKNLDATERYSKKHKLGHPLPIGRQVLADNYKQATEKSQKLLSRREGPYRVTKQLTATNYEVVLVKDEDVHRIYHRKQIVSYFPKEETIPPLLARYRINNFL